jgi:hypothetical protein
MNPWYAIVESRTGDIDALICSSCYERFPLKQGLTPINDLMGCLSRRCAICNKEVYQSIKEEVKQAA